MHAHFELLFHSSAVQPVQFIQFLAIQFAIQSSRVNPLATGLTSFSYAFWLNDTINYSKVKSVSVLNCTKISLYNHNCSSISVLSISYKIPKSMVHILLCPCGSHDNFCYHLCDFCSSILAAILNIFIHNYI